MGLRASNTNIQQIIIKPNLNGASFYFAESEQGLDKTIWRTEIPMQSIWWNYNTSTQRITNSMSGNCLTGSRFDNILTLRPCEPPYIYQSYQRFEYLNDSHSLYWIDPNDLRQYGVYPHRILNKALISPNPRGPGPNSTPRERLLLAKKLMNERFGASHFIEFITKKIQAYQQLYSQIKLRGDEFPCFLQGAGDEKAVQIINIKQIRYYPNTKLWYVDSAGFVMHYLSNKELRVSRGNHGLYHPILEVKSEIIRKFVYRVKAENINDKQQLYFVDVEDRYKKYICQKVTRLCAICGVCEERALLFILQQPI